MGQPAARLTDLHTCPMHVSGPIATPGMPRVLTGGLPQARITDSCLCAGIPDVIVQGAPTVLVGGMPAARIGDMTAHGGVIVKGLATVLIGGAGAGGGGGGAAAGTGGGSSYATSSDVADAAIGALAIGGYTPRPQARALKAAAKSRAPFCERCPAA